MNRRGFIKVFFAGTTWVASTSWADFFGKTTDIITPESSPGLKLVKETGDIQNTDEYILISGKKFCTINYHTHNIDTEIVYKLGNLFYFRSDLIEYNDRSDQNYLLMSTEDEIVYDDTFCSGYDAFHVEGPYDSLGMAFSSNEIYDFGSALKSIECSEMNSSELAQLLPLPDFGSTILINDEVWGYNEDEEYTCLELIAS